MTVGFWGSLGGNELVSFGASVTVASSFAGRLLFSWRALVVAIDSAVGCAISMDLILSILKIANSSVNTIDRWRIMMKRTTLCENHCWYYFRSILFVQGRILEVDATHKMYDFWGISGTPRRHCQRLHCSRKEDSCIIKQITRNGIEIAPAHAYFYVTDVTVGRIRNRKLWSRKAMGLLVFPENICRNDWCSSRLSGTRNHF